MTVKRNKINEYIIREFLNDKMTGYSAEHNGEWYFSLENSDFYNGKILRYRNNMGHTIKILDQNNVTEAANAIQETLVNLPDIIKQEKAINEYCVNNPWTYSGT